jgi:hypothetical protein
LQHSELPEQHISITGYTEDRAVCHDIHLNGELQYVRPESGDLTNRDNRCLEAIHKVVCNLLLYLKYNPSILCSGGKVVNKDHGLDSLFYEVGNEVKLDRQLRDAARDFCVSGTRPQGWTLAKRFVVRGHWKQQACGPEHSERKLIFIKPYWKGPPDAPVLARTYTAGEDAPQT